MTQQWCGHSVVLHANTHSKDIEAKHHSLVYLVGKSDKLIQHPGPLLIPLSDASHTITSVDMKAITNLAYLVVF